VNAQAVHESLRDTHTPEAIGRRLDEGPSNSYLRDWIYGAIDGAVTTFAVVCGVAGAELAAGIIIILGTANLFADGFSMAVSNFLGTRAEREHEAKARKNEELHVRLIPDGEREEIRQIFARKGFEGEDLDRAVEIITADLSQWVDTMLVEEHGITSHAPSAWHAATATFVAFLLAGSVPLLPYIADAIIDVPGDPFALSVGMTGVAFFIVGSIKSRIVDQPWLRSGLETLLVGGIAAVVAFAAGAILKNMAG
jgi:VIT1/CCC1 family predicted Fe2+/Mn2+ transporter